MCYIYIIIILSCQFRNTTSPVGHWCCLHEKVLMKTCCVNVTDMISLTFAFAGGGCSGRGSGAAWLPPAGWHDAIPAASYGRNHHLVTITTPTIPQQTGIVPFQYERMSVKITKIDWPMFWGFICNGRNGPLLCHYLFLEIQPYVIFSVNNQMIANNDSKLRKVHNYCTKFSQR